MREGRERARWEPQPRWFRHRRWEATSSRYERDDKQWQRNSWPGRGAQSWRSQPSVSPCYGGDGFQWQRMGSEERRTPFYSRPGGGFPRQRQQLSYYSPRNHGSAQQQRQQRFRDRHQQTSKAEGKCFSVYIDGLGDRITLMKLKAIFGKAGRVCNVFVQFKKKFQRRFRCGFVRFHTNAEEQRAIRLFNGMRLDGNSLVVKRAKPQKAFGVNTAKSSKQQQVRATGKMWRPKAQQQQQSSAKEQEMQNNQTAQPQESAKGTEACQLRLSDFDLDEVWYQCCARARMLEPKPVQVLQDEFAQIGLYNFRFIPLGANGVVLEFENKEEMEDTLLECKCFLELKLSEVRPCTMLTYGVAQLVWIRLWQVPMGVWTESFFTAVGNRLGSFVSLDSATKLRHRADFARILIRMHHPLFQRFTMAVDVNGISCIILLEKEDSAYDYGKMEDMPSTPVKIYNSEDDIQSEDDFENEEDINVDEAMFQATSFAKEYESAEEVVSEEEDEAYRNDKLEGLQVLDDAHFTMADEGVNLPVVSGCQASKPEAAAAQAFSADLGQLGAVFKNSKSNVIKAAINSGEELKEQLQTLKESGYTHEEIKGWWKNISSEGILAKEIQICFNDIQNPVTNIDKKFSVTGYSFNSQDLVHNCSWPLYSTYWDPQILIQQQEQRPCLPLCFHSQNDLLRFATTSATLTTSVLQETKHVQREVCIRTSPHQIIRQTDTCASLLPLERDLQASQTPQKPQTPTVRVDPSTPTLPAIQESPNTTSSKKSSQRGRPKGSKNKPKALPADYLEPMTGEDGVSTRAQRVWLIGKQLGLKPRDSEALVLRGLEAQIRENHPHLN